MNLLKSRNFSLFYFGCLVSLIGSVLCNFATSLFILDISGSAFAMSLYLAYTTILGLILTPIMGTYSDRLSKVKCVVVCDFLFGITDLALAIALFSGIKGYWLWVALFLNATINRIVSSMSDPASSSMIPLLVNKDELQKAYSVFNMMHNAVYIFGFLCAALLYSLFSYELILFINAITFLFASMCELFIKVKESIQKEEKKDFIKELKEGFTYLYDRKELLSVAKVSICMNICLTAAFSVSIPYIVNTYFELHPMVLALVSVSISSGAIIAAIVLSKKEVNSTSKAIKVGFLHQVLCQSLLLVVFIVFEYSVVSWIVFSLLLFAVCFYLGCLNSYIQIPLDTSYAKRVEEGYMGRVMSIRTTLATIATPVAMLVSGVMIDYIGVGSVLLSCVILVCFTSLYTLKNKHLKGLDGDVNE